MHKWASKGMNRRVCARWKPNPSTPRKGNGPPRIILLAATFAIVLERKGHPQNDPKNKGEIENRSINWYCREHPGSPCRAAITAKVSSMLSDAWLVSGPTASFILLRHSQSRSIPKPTLLHIPAAPEAHRIYIAVLAIGSVFLFLSAARRLEDHAPR
ncbi:hypothetical protein L211DRAFT_584304 [Terfezia boudieri ATCC MYA-4762]|uniref:Uncharacterized protein n=1 Tax=Terfezia boudieri ATCC MYA-4762 TaxID=1051890 RepID=A0A3N4LAA5_9PEZI|nr:hypothetical protein L211DRAFT_584304 [Terfezia boudieri ATCC MYA-4762]